MTRLIIDKEALFKWMQTTKELYASEMRGEVRVRFYVYLNSDGVRYEVERMVGGKINRMKYIDLDQALYEFNEN